MSLRDFDSGLQSAFELLWKSFSFLVCLKIAQLSFKWADICSWEDAHLLRFNSGELATLSLDESWMKWQKEKRVYNSLHKRLKCLSVSILHYCSLFTHNTGWLLLRPVRWELNKSNIGVSTWRCFTPCRLSPILGYTVHLNCSIVYCVLV